MSFSDCVHVRWQWRTVAARKISCIIRGKIRHGVSSGCGRDRTGMINRQPSTCSEIYGHRARIGYACPPLSAEVFPYEFYKLDYRFRESCHKRGIHLSFQAPICAGALRMKD
jgi:hypothetical protein